MKAAVLFSVPTKAEPGYCWRWRSVDGRACSQKHFVYYYDCVTNALANGYEAQVETAVGARSPGHGAVKPNHRAF
jgi:hypothetical protein